MKKGITPIIAIILLLLITVALVAFVFTFLTRTVEQSGEQIGTGVDELGTSTSQRVNIVGASLSSGTITVTVQNSGSSTISAGGITARAERKTGGQQVGTPGTTVASTGALSTSTISITGVTCTTGTVLKITAETAGGFIDTQDMTC